MQHAGTQQCIRPSRAWAKKEAVPAPRPQARPRRRYEALHGPDGSSVGPSHGTRARLPLRSVVPAGGDAMVVAKHRCSGLTAGLPGHDTRRADGLGSEAGLEPSMAVETSLVDACRTSMCACSERGRWRFAGTARVLNLAIFVVNGRAWDDSLLIGSHRSAFAASSCYYVPMLAEKCDAKTSHGQPGAASGTQAHALRKSMRRSFLVAHFLTLPRAASSHYVR